MNVPPISYILDLIEREGRIDDFNAYTLKNELPFVVSVIRFYLYEMGYPWF